MTQSKNIKTYVEFLKMNNADQTSHSGRSLLDHLEATYRLLVEWGNSTEICIAGLFHSIYGTQSFRFQTISGENRELVKSLIGPNSEYLAHLFCTHNRRDFYNSPDSNGYVSLTQLKTSADESPRITKVSVECIAQLLEIESANMIEQIPSMWSKKEIDYIVICLERLLAKKDQLSTGAVNGLQFFHKEALVRRKTYRNEVTLEAVTIQCREPEKLAYFYHKLFGFSEPKKYGNQFGLAKGNVYWGFEKSDIQTPIESRTCQWIRVESIEEFTEKIVELGGTIKSGTDVQIFPGQKTIQALDLEKNVIGIICSKQQAY